MDLLDAIDRLCKRPRLVRQAPDHAESPNLLSPDELQDLLELPDSSSPCWCEEVIGERWRYYRQPDEEFSSAAGPTSPLPVVGSTPSVPLTAEEQATWLAMCARNRGLYGLA